MTPLHWAVEREYLEVIHILLEHGADANATSKFDKTPISLALEHDRLDLVDILQQEREIQAHQQNQANSAELEVATHNLIQLETEKEEEQKFEIQQQSSQHKRKFTQGEYYKIYYISIYTLFYQFLIFIYYVISSIKNLQYKLQKNLGWSFNRYMYRQITMNRRKKLIMLKWLIRIILQIVKNIRILPL